MTLLNNLINEPRITRGTRESLIGKVKIRKKKKQKQVNTLHQITGSGIQRLLEWSLPSQRYVVLGGSFQYYLVLKNNKSCSVPSPVILPLSFLGLPRMVFHHVGILVLILYSSLYLWLLLFVLIQFLLCQRSCLFFVEVL